MSETKRNAFGTIGLGVVLGLFILVLLAALPAAGQRAFATIETASFPVVGLADVHDLRSVDDGCEFGAVAHKNRGCPWRETIVYLGRRDGLNVMIESNPHKDKPTLRDVGTLEWQRIFVPVPCSDVGKTFADSYHQCRGEDGSMTRSRFWNNSTESKE